MYRGFKLESFRFISETYAKQMIALGRYAYNQNKLLIESRLQNFMSSDNSLDGTLIQNTWFPQIDADVFISHSHEDEEMAIMLAGWLEENFKIRSFIDSCVWGYANDLLKIIDNKYCLNEGGLTYNYDTRNYSTSHVHMMLSTALSMMIDKAECLIFLNTPESIKPKDGITKTQSPWIYFEIGMSQVIRKQEPLRYLTESRKLFHKGEKIEKALQVNYTVDLNHLEEIDYTILEQWLNADDFSSADDALDKLYEIMPARKYSDTIHG